MTRSKVKKIQRALSAKGFKPGPIDGDRGRLTNKAIIAFKKSIGYAARDYFGPLTEAALFDGRVDRGSQNMPGRKNAGDARRLDGVQKFPAWVRVARSYLGLQEYRGNRHNPKILEWWVKLRLPFTDDETPWCAGYVGGVLEECGIRSTRSAAARSYNWQDWGVRLNGPAVGAVVVFWRKQRKGPYGHVGIVVGRDQFGNIMVIGGNQRNRVSIKPFASTRVLSYHYPKGHSLPARTGIATLPVVTSNGRVSQNEA